MVKERVYWNWLCHISQIGSKNINAMLEYFGSPKAIFNSSQKDYQQFKGIGEKGSIFIENSKQMDLDVAYQMLEQQGIQLILENESDYPKRLRQLPDKPIGLYVKGELPKEDTPAVAIVGARACSRYGLETARQVGEFLGSHGILVISGMASGIDGAGQWGAIQGNGKSFGVLGCGVNICYPSENRPLYERLLVHGGILSEYAPDVRPDPKFFPIRNRIISGLSDIVVVVEAREKSGSFITVDLALEQGKDVFAVPGRIGDVLSKGCHNLIKNGAGILTEPEILYEELSIKYKNLEIKQKKIQKENKIILAQKEKMVYSGLDLQPKNIQSIIDETGLDVQEVSKVLVALSLKGLVVEVGRNYYAVKNDIK